jgi:hypothetical protein
VPLVSAASLVPSSPAPDEPGPPGCTVGCDLVCHAEGPETTDGLVYLTVSADAGSAGGFDRFLASGSHTDRMTVSSALASPLRLEAATSAGPAWAGTDGCRLGRRGLASGFAAGGSAAVAGAVAWSPGAAPPTDWSSVRLVCSVAIG